MSAESAHGHISWLKIFIAALVAVGIGYLAFLGYQYSLAKNLSERLPGKGEVIAFTDRGVADTYLMSEFSFSRADLEEVEGITVLESKEWKDGERVILGQKDGTSGVVLAVVRPQGVEVLLSDGTNKSDLVVTPNGVAVFSVAERPAFFPEDVSASSIEAPDSSEPEETGTADGPVPFIIDEQDEQVETEEAVQISTGLFSFDLAEKKLVSLGSGKTPRAYGLDAVLAITEEGVVAIDVFTGARGTLIAYRGGNAAGSSLSPNGMIAALRREGSATVEIFRVTNGAGVYLGQIFSASPMYGTAILGEGHIFVRTGKDTVALYALSENIATAQPHIAELGLLMPN